MKTKILVKINNNNDNKGQLLRFCQKTKKAMEYESDNRLGFMACQTL